MSVYVEIMKIRIYLTQIRLGFILKKNVNYRFSTFSCHLLLVIFLKKYKPFNFSVVRLITTVRNLYMLSFLESANSETMKVLII